MDIDEIDETDTQIILLDEEQKTEQKKKYTKTYYGRGYAKKGYKEDYNLHPPSNIHRKVMCYIRSFLFKQKNRKL